MKTLLMDGQVIGPSETGDGCGTEGGGQTEQQLAQRA